MEVDMSVMRLSRTFLAFLTITLLLNGCGSPQFWSNLEYAACILDKTKNASYCEQFKPRN
jgi:hypothetical protein